MIMKIDKHADNKRVNRIKEAVSHTVEGYSFAIHSRTETPPYNKTFYCTCGGLVGIQGPIQNLEKDRETLPEEVLELIRRYVKAAMDTLEEEEKRKAEILRFLSVFEKEGVE